jgi:hypothetical protein
MLLTSKAPRVRASSSWRSDRCKIRELSRRWKGADLLCQRDALSLQWLNGEGLEIGALHKPVKICGAATVKYVDYKTLDENRKRYPELAGEAIVQTDIVDDGFVLETIPDSSIDFIVANHALEPSPDPYGTLLTWKTRIAVGGILFIAVPIADRCYDRGRPITTLKHLLEDHRRFQQADVKGVLHGTREHLVEFLTISDRNIRIQNNLPLQTHDWIVTVAEKRFADLEARVREAIGPWTAETSRSSPARSGRSFLSGWLDKIRRVDAALPTRPEGAELAKQLISAHVQGLNRVYDIHYHTFSPYSYYALLSHFCRQEGMCLEDIRKSGSGECIAIMRKKDPASARPQAARRCVVLDTGMPARFRATTKN